MHVLVLANKQSLPHVALVLYLTAGSQYACSYGTLCSCTPTHPCIMAVPTLPPAGAPVMHPAQQQQYPQQQQQQYQQLPQQQQQQPAAGLVHPSALPALRPPPVHVVEQHTYVHLPAQDEPIITRSSAAMPRHITCPACFMSGPTHVTRQPGCCAYLVSSGQQSLHAPALLLLSTFTTVHCSVCQLRAVHRQINTTHLASAPPYSLPYPLGALLSTHFPP